MKFADHTATPQSFTAYFIRLRNL